MLHAFLTSALLAFPSAQSTHDAAVATHINVLCDPRTARTACLHCDQLFQVSLRTVSTSGELTRPVCRIPLRPRALCNADGIPTASARPVGMPSRSANTADLDSHARLALTGYEVGSQRPTAVRQLRERRSTRPHSTSGFHNCRPVRGVLRDGRDQSLLSRREATPVARHNGGRFVCKHPLRRTGSATSIPDRRFGRRR
jgi:hypothetical protein